jgi:FIST-like protein
MQIDQSPGQTTWAGSDGLHVNGSELVNGLTARVPPGVSITGGLSGDGARFEETAVLWDAKPRAPERAGIACTELHPA